MRSQQRICSVGGIGMLPNKLKNTASEEIGNGVFSHMARHMPCLPVFYQQSFI